MTENKQYSSEIEIPQGVNVTLNSFLVTVNGPKGSTMRKFAHPKILIVISENKIMLNTYGSVSKREKKVLNTFTAHLKNMVDGVTIPYLYKLKICSGHFPMNVSIDKETLIIKNFLGEKIPRKVKLTKNVQVSVTGDIISVSSVDKELAGMMSSSIEQSTRITNKDRRKFMDGIWMIEKSIQNG